MNEQIQLIVCPWCYRTMEILAEEETFTCSVCDRIITEDSNIKTTKKINQINNNS